MESNPDQFPSLDSGEIDQHMPEEGAMFHTPPEHHSHSHLSSSEDRNPNELCAERTTKVRALEAGWGDEPETKRVRTVVETEGVIVLGSGESAQGSLDAAGNHELGGRERQLPPSFKDAVENSDRKSSQGLLDLVDVLKAVFEDTDGGSEDVDFIETAKRKGIKFPRPRWWPSPGDHF